MHIEKTYDSKGFEVYLLHTEKKVYDLDSEKGLQIVNEMLGRIDEPSEVQRLTLALALEKQKHYDTAHLLEQVINERNQLDTQLQWTNNSIRALLDGHNAKLLITQLVRLSSR